MRTSPDARRCDGRLYNLYQLLHYHHSIFSPTLRNYPFDPGLTWDETKARCPEGVVAACHNSIDTVTISGPVDTVRSFVEVLKSEDVFAKEVKSAGVAFHSPFMQKASPLLKEALLKVQFTSLS